MNDSPVSLMSENHGTDAMPTQCQPSDRVVSGC